MIDGIRRTSIGINSGLNLTSQSESEAKAIANDVKAHPDQKQTINDLKEAVRTNSNSGLTEAIKQEGELKESSHKPALGYAQLRDCFEIPKSTISQNTNISTYDVPIKIDQLPQIF